MASAAGEMRQSWQRLKSGLYIPPFLKRLHRDEIGGWFPCCGARCEHCTGVPPVDLQIVLADIAEDGCGACVALNDTWIVTYDAEYSYCVWFYYLESPICEVNIISAWRSVLGESWILQVFLHRTIPDYVLYFRKEYEIKPSCTPADESLAVVYEDPIWACDGSAATCVVSAV